MDDNHSPRLFARADAQNRRQLERFCQVLLRVPHTLVAILQLAAVETFLASPMIAIFGAVSQDRMLLGKCASMAIAQSGASGETLMRESTLPVAILAQYSRDAWSRGLARMSKSVMRFVNKFSGAIEIDVDRMKASESLEANLANYSLFITGAIDLVVSSLKSDGVPSRVVQVSTLLRASMQRNTDDCSSVSSRSPGSLSESRARRRQQQEQEEASSPLVAGFVFLHLICPALSEVIAGCKKPDVRRRATTLCRVLQQIACAPSELAVAVSGVRDATIDRLHQECWMTLQSLAGDIMSARMGSGSGSSSKSSRSASIAPSSGSSSSLSRLFGLRRSSAPTSSAAVVELSEQDQNHVPKKVSDSDDVFAVWSYCASQRQRMVLLIDGLESIARIDVTSAELATLINDILSPDNEPQPEFKVRDQIATTMRKVLANNMSLLWQSEGALALELVSTSSVLSDKQSSINASRNTGQLMPALRYNHHDDTESTMHDDDLSDLTTASFSTASQSNTRNRFSIEAEDEREDFGAWSAEDVGEYMAQFVGDDVAQLFVQHQIQGIDFVTLSREDMRMIGITQLGVVKAIERAQAKFAHTMRLSR